MRLRVADRGALSTGLSGYNKDSLSMEHSG